MSRADPSARRRWWAIQATRLAGFAGAVLGLMLVARSMTMAPRILGIAIVLSAMLMIAIVPPALAHRWKTRG